jgi:excisionase family DNA binding protein
MGDEEISSFPALCSTNSIYRDLFSYCAEVKEMKRLLTVPEVATALNLKSSTIRVWLTRKILPRVKCGRAVRVPAEAVERFIDANTTPAREGRNAH